MKEDKPKGKSQKDQTGPGRSDAQTPSFQKEAAKEDVDFEILDALEQIEQTGKGNGENLAEAEDNFELSLEGEDLLFNEEEPGEEGEFHFDESLTAGLDVDFTGKAEEFSDDQINLEDEAFSLDLDQEDDVEGAGDLSFDAETELDLKGEPGETSFDLGEMGDMNFTPDTDLDAAEEDAADETLAETLDFGAEPSETLAEDTFALDDALAGQETSDLGLEDTDDTFNEIDLGDMSDVGDNFDFESDSAEESSANLEIPGLDLADEDEADELAGKAVISVGKDQVIDLGNEAEFDQAAEAVPAENTYSAEPPAFPEAVDLAEEETDEDFSEEEASATVEQLLAKLGSEQDYAEEPAEEESAAEKDGAAEETGESTPGLDELEVDLEEETTKVLETLEGTDEFSELPEEEAADFDSDDFDFTPEKEPPAEVPTPLAAEIIAQTPQPLAGQPEMEAAPVEPAAAEPVATTEPEVDEREELGLTPSLTETEIQKFESMVTEAKTLQRYVEELDGHKAEIKEKIYQKLLQEYTSRKADLFREPEFISIRIDVEQDLQEMLARRTEFVATIDRLNDDLEEVKVRHLVGEYSDAMRAEQETAQQTEIVAWHGKTEKIEQFITRYQELLETERKLNPVEEEPLRAEPPQEPRPETEVAAPGKAAIPPKEMPVAEELTAAEKMFPGDEEQFTEEELLPAAEDAAAEMETESLADVLRQAQDEDFGLDELPESEDLGLDELPELDEEVAEEPIAHEPPAAIPKPVVSVSAPAQEEAAPADMITCKKCGRTTPAAEKFCVNCGAKAR